MEKNTIPKIYTIGDFHSWSTTAKLITKPKYQRNKVWTSKAKSYLIDSIIKGYPISSIYLYEKTDPKDMNTIREIIDGQQRVTTILEFLKGDFRILAIHNKEYGGKSFLDLDMETKQLLLSYNIPCHVLLFEEIETIQEVFTRLNTFNMPLNSQELRNAQFFGLVRTTIDELARYYIEDLYKLLREKKSIIYKENGIKRMQVQEDFAKLLIFLKTGYTDDVSKNITKFYKDYDSEESFDFSFLKQEFISIFNNILKIYKILLTYVDKIYIICDRKYVITLFMYFKNYKFNFENTDLLINKFKLLDENLFAVSSRTKKAKEKIKTLNTAEIKWFEEFRDLNQKSTNNPNRKALRVEKLNEFFSWEIE